MAKRIVLESHDPNWLLQFEELRQRFAKALDPIAVAIEHVGSTAVPGLVAKPILDIAIAVRTAADVPEACRRMADLGYVHRGDLGIAGREAFDTPPDSIRHHPYVLAADAAEFHRMVRFRDRLRSDPDVRREYERHKREQAERLVYMTPEYWESKSELIERVLSDSVT